MEDLTYGLIKKSLDASALRQKVIANNISNINTKNFKRSDVVFEDVLNGEPIDSVEPQVAKDSSTSMREDGNNVDIDYEMTNMAANEILYNTMITQLNTKYSILRYSIEEGSK